MAQCLHPVDVVPGRCAVSSGPPSFDNEAAEALSGPRFVWVRRDAVGRVRQADDLDAGIAAELLEGVRARAAFAREAAPPFRIRMATAMQVVADQPPCILSAIQWVPGHRPGCMVSSRR
jgi:hypothetical protein